MLVRHFVTKYAAEFGRKIELVPKAVMDSFQTYHWPGNVRELENIIEHAFILCPEGLILRDHLPAALSRRMNPPPVSFAGKTLAQIEALVISEAIERHGGNRSAVARELGVDKTTIWRKMKKLESREQS